MATFVAKIKQNQPPVKDRGAKVVWEDMIHSWVLYEVVKVIYLFGLNPGINKHCKKTSPDIHQYLKDMEEGTASTESVELNNILFNKTKHRSNFIGDKTECTFAHIENTTWVADVQYQLPFLILTWMRQLQQMFFEDDKVRWNSLGRYAPTTKPNSDERRNPLTAINFTTDSGSDIQNLMLTKIKKIVDIVPQTPSSEQGVCRSLEEWAILRFTPSVPQKLEHALNEDCETKQRYENINKHIAHKHVWKISDTDYSRYGGQQNDKYVVDEIQETEKYKKMTPEDLNYTMVTSFLKINDNAEKLMKKKKTKSDVELRNSTKSGISAYMALVNKNNEEAEANAMEITDLKAYQKLLKKNRKRCLRNE